MSEPIIELSGLTKKYDGSKRRSIGLTLSIYQGEVFGLLGPNGAGKSTTILMMLGLSEPTSGSVRVCGIDSTRQPIHVKKKVGYFRTTSASTKTGQGWKIYYIPPPEPDPQQEAKREPSNFRKGRTERCRTQKTGTYSRGMRQRLGLADVLIKQPEVIVLDEPTLGIDPKGVRELLELIRTLSKVEGLTVLLSSHHLHQVQQICDRVGLFVKGRLLAVGDVLVCRSSFLPKSRP